MEATLEAVKQSEQGAEPQIPEARDEMLYDIHFALQPLIAVVIRLGGVPSNFPIEAAEVVAWTAMATRARLEGLESKQKGPHELDYQRAEALCTAIAGAAFIAAGGRFAPEGESYLGPKRYQPEAKEAFSDMETLTWIAEETWPPPSFLRGSSEDQEEVSHV